MNCLGLRLEPSFGFGPLEAATQGASNWLNSVSSSMRRQQHHRQSPGTDHCMRRVGLTDSDGKELGNTVSYQVKSPTPVMDLRDFLTSAELDQYYDQFSTVLKVTNVAQIKYVEETDLISIGMTKPEIRRLRQIYKKTQSRGALGKLKKLVKGTSDASNTSPPAPTSANDKQPSLHSSPSNKHLITEDAITLQKVLGSGEFGVVQQGVWTNERGERIPVAVKCLSKDKVKSQINDFVLEAKNMCTVDHNHIVQLYGVVLGSDTFMLVTELAPLRTLLECLRDPLLKSSFTVPLICTLAAQIADGMAYLENRRLIHRDLAARNILMFAKDKVKVSDFGLSRALGVEKDYYQSQLSSNLKLPVAWCAPECINYLKFTHASDVWSFGVTLWEMFSAGAQPWQGMTGIQIVEAVDTPNCRRLEQPERCPDDWYQLMLKCWESEPNDRPKFGEMHVITLNQIKPMRVVATVDVSFIRPRWLTYKIGDIIVVLSKHHAVDGASDAWKGVLESSNDVGYYEPVTTAPYIEVAPSNALLRKGKVQRVESSRTSLRTSKKLTSDMIGLPQNDLRHVGHVGYDGAVFGDVASYIGEDYSKLPVKVGNPQKASLITLPPSSNATGKDSTVSAAATITPLSTSATFSSAPNEDDDFSDFQLPDLSFSLDFGASGLMDDVLKALGEPSSTIAVPASSQQSNNHDTVGATQVISEYPWLKTSSFATTGNSVDEPSTTVANEAERSDDSDEETASQSENSDSDGEQDASSACSGDHVFTTDHHVPSIQTEEHVTATVQSDYIHQPMPSSAVITRPSGTASSGGSSFGPNKRLYSLDTSSALRSSQNENHNSHDSSDASDNEYASKNGYGSSGLSPESAAAYDELVGHKRSSSGSSANSSGRKSWNAASDLFSNSSSTEQLKGTSFGTASSSSRVPPPFRTSNQNIRVPQIPGRDAAVAARNPIIPGAPPPASAAIGNNEQEMDTNPLRRLRDSQAGFGKTAVFRPSVGVSSLRSDSIMPSTASNLNPNMSFFDKLKEQEQQRMH